MIRDQEMQVARTIDDHAIVVDQIFTIEEVIWCQQKVPWQATEPRQAMNAVHLVANRNDFLETFHLHEQCLNVIQVSIINTANVEMYVSKQFTVIMSAKGPP